MVWDASLPNAGFTEGRPWLPVKEAQAANAVAGQLGAPDSVFEFYRSMLGLRRRTEALRTGRTRFFDVEEPILAFTRGGTVLCVFNLSPEVHRVHLSGTGALAVAQGAEHAADGTMKLHPNGFAIMEAGPDVAVSDLPALAASPAL
jgi:alpha-glucosidase